jgi:mRNA-degrading endonuclease toxin of MazEF toxin-antitoxin module
VLLTAQATSLPKDSVANTSHVIAIDRSLLFERVSKLSRARLELILSGLDIVLGR